MAAARQLGPPTSFKKPRAARIYQFGEVSEACHGRRIRQELSEPSAVSSLYCDGRLRRNRWSVPL